jgi:ATP-dependent DNA helicase RecQ
VCAPQLRPEIGADAPRAGGRAGPDHREREAGGALVACGDLDGAIVEVVERATPAVGRTRVVEILRGGRSKVVLKYSYDGLPRYGAFDHLSSGQVLSRVDELIAEGRLVSTGGAYPKLRVAA